MVYDVHAHCIPQPLIDWMERKGSEVGIEVLSSDGKKAVLVDGRYRTAPLNPTLTSPQRRLEKLDEMRVDVQVLAGWIDLTGYQLPGPKGLEWAKAQNEIMAEEAATSPDRYLAMATVPLQDPAAAATELRRCVTDLGMVGVEIATRVDDTALDQAGLDEFWSTAAELGALVMLHPMAPLPGIDLNRYFMHNAVGRPAESTLALAGMIFGGVFERHPNLEMVIVHGGGYAPFQIGRFDQGYRSKPDEAGAHISKPPSDYLKRLYVDTVVHEPAVLKFLVDYLGSERVMLGTDYPFPMGSLDPVTFVESVGLDDTTRDAILTGNAKRVLENVKRS